MISNILIGLPISKKKILFLFFKLEHCKTKLHASLIDMKYLCIFLSVNLIGKSFLSDLKNNNADPSLPITLPNLTMKYLIFGNFFHKS